jgi:hypothetical protein
MTTLGAARTRQEEATIFTTSPPPPPGGRFVKSNIPPLLLLLLLLLLLPLLIILRRTTVYQQISPASSHSGNDVCFEQPFLILLLFLRGVARSRAASTGPHSSRALCASNAKPHLSDLGAHLPPPFSSHPSLLAPPSPPPASTSRVWCRGLAVSVSTFSLGSEIRLQG